MQCAAGKLTYLKKEKPNNSAAVHTFFPHDTDTHQIIYLLYVLKINSSGCPPFWPMDIDRVSKLFSAISGISSSVCGRYSSFDIIECFG